MPELKKIKRIPWGFHFKDPEFVKKREGTLEQASGILKESGFERVIPSGLDYAYSFERAAMSDWQPHIMRLSDGYGENLALRPDLTIQIIKGLANQTNRVELPAHLYYMENTFRNTKKATGAFREQFQIGAEIIGENEPEGPLKLITLLVSIMEKIAPPEPFKLALGHAGFFEKISALWDLDDNEKNELAALLNKKSIPDLKIFFQKHLRLNKYKELFIETILAFGSLGELENLREKWYRDFPAGDIHKVFDDYISFYRLLKDKIAEDYIFPDFVMVRDFRYYTGIVFEGYITGSGNRIFSGGSYNNLFERYSGKKENACGFAIILEYLEFYKNTELKI